MKYLKLYENHNKYYTKIGLQEFDATIFDEWLDIKGPDEVLSFDEKEINYLKNVCELYSGKFNTKNRQQLHDGEIDGGNDIVQIKIVGENDIVEDCPILIYKVVDEWYYVMAMGGVTHLDVLLKSKDNGIWYKCDQLYGLKKLVEKILSDRNEIH